MKKPLSILVVFLTFVGSLSAEFRAAMAIRVITPDPLLPISGGLGPSNPVKSKAADLTARAFVFEQGTTRVAIVQMDFLGFPQVLANKIRSKVKGIEPQNILVGATHTHSAPDAYGFPGGGAKLDYLDWVCDRAAEAINEAVEKLQPAKLKIATGNVGENIAYNYYAPELYDRRASIIQALDASGKPFATLVNYAIHPEVLSSSGGVLSPDLVAPLCDRIQAKIGGQAMFMNGAQGGMITADNRDKQNPGSKDIRTWEEAVRIGTLLADRSLELLQNAPVQDNPGLFCVAKSITLPVDNARIRLIMAGSPLGLAKANGGDLSKVKTQLNLVNLGEAQIVSIPGEALPNIGFYLKRKMTGKQNLLFGLTNDSFGYIMTKVDFRSFKRYDYISDTSLGEMTGEILIEEIEKLIAESPKPKI